MAHQSMLLHFGIQIPELWFEQLHSDSIPGFFQIIGICVGMAFIKTFIAAARYKIQCCFINSNRPLSRVGYRLLGTILLVLDCITSYMLMLAFMYKNVWLCVSIIIGHVISYLVIGWYRIVSVPSKREKRPVFVKRTESQMKRDSRLFDRPYSTAIERQTGVHLKLFNPNYEPNQSENTSPSEQPETSNNNPAPHKETDLSLDEVTSVYKPETSTDNQLESPSDVFRPLINQQGAERGDNQPTQFEELRRGSLMERYPVLKFHNNDIAADRDRSSSIDFDELDDLVQHLQQQ